MNLPLSPLGATVQGLTNYLRTLITSIQAGWRVQHNDDGTHRFTWVDVSYDANDFTASSGTWTVGALDVLNYSIAQIGKVGVIALTINSTSVSATPSNLFVRLPGDIFVPKQVVAICRIHDNGTERMGLCVVQDSLITFYAIDTATGATTNFSASSNATHVQAQAIVEIA